MSNKIPKWKVPLSDLDYDRNESAAVQRVLKSRWLSMGQEVEAFEKEFSKTTQTKHAFAIANATAGLHLAYASLGIRPGDEIIQPAINFVAAANMTMAVGAKPVLADIISLEEPTIDPEDVRRKITSKTKAVVAMHYGGFTSRMTDLLAICRGKNIALIEDACHAVGSAYHGKAIGSLADIACFSFFSNKNIATGEGGMITTDRDDLAAQLKLLRSHGMTRLTWDRYLGHANSYNVVENGYNYRLDEIHAALGRCQLKKLKRNNGRRGKLVKLYRKLLKGSSRWLVPFSNYVGDSAYHLMVILAPDSATRDQATEALKKHGIQTSLHYPCIAEFDAFKATSHPGLDKSHVFANRVITLPLYPTMKESAVQQICKVLTSL